MDRNEFYMKKEMIYNNFSLPICYQQKFLFKVFRSIIVMFDSKHIRPSGQVVVSKK